MPTPSAKLEFIEKWRHALAPYNVGYKLKLASQLMYRDFLERLEPYKLTPFHYLVLCCLWEEDGLSTSGIAEKLGQLGATLTGVVDRMEERKLVQRERDATDRRIVRIWLTSAGEELKEVLPVIGEQTIDRALAGMTQADREKVSSLLDRIIANAS
ncbi:MarR family transcriptional regulator [Nostocaceae cyanobacterium CENA357]|uniref:MarR family transcriptional regulator n=1 Tax=Atlanticothrix silvestris CENA357 TaxID=1725252 RepID=A0A8J7HEQ3_9CYAN|nr:MarR family transcriptional regulator [Atlanticothrix silvestris]MBH8554393.1 MarR family transcriptional regulator [Atlanticothrix silvestris CENA357]